MALRIAQGADKLPDGLPVSPPVRQTEVVVTGTLDSREPFGRAGGGMQLPALAKGDHLVGGAVDDQQGGSYTVLSTPL